MARTLGPLGVTRAGEDWGDAELKNETSQLLEAFVDLGVALTQDLDVEQVLTVIVERAMAHTGARYGAAAGLSSEGEIAHFVYRGLTPEQVAMLPHLPRGLGLLGLVASTRETIRLEKISDHPASVGFPDHHVPMDAFMGVPLMHRGQLLGMLYLTKSPGAEPFSEDDEEYLRAVGSLAAVGLENARLFASESQRAERSIMLRHIATRVRHSLDITEVLNATAEALGRGANVDRCYIRLAGEAASLGVLEPIEIEWDAPGIAPLKEAPDQQFPIASLAALSRETEWTEDVEGDDRLKEDSLPGSDQLERDARAALATPLLWGEDLLGVVVFHATRPRKWSDADIALIEAAAREVSVALHHAGLYADAVHTADRLKQLDEMRSDFVSMVSHELRSPMTVIAGIADLLQTRSDQLSQEQHEELLKTLAREARRLSKLVSEVLDLEAFDQGRVSLQLDELDLATVVRESVEDSGHSERIDVRIASEPVLISGDRDRLKQVLLNLVSNAAKFSPDGARVGVEVSEDSDSVVVAVRDSGPGIAPEDQSKLFQRFSRLPSTNQRKPGTGLGLYLSRVLIEAHGGQVWVESEPGKGATFFFSFPRREPSKESSK